jgi:hypothetical protein
LRNESAEEVEMAKKVAILVRDRKGEALRMGVGATLADDEIHIFVMDDKLEPDDEMSLNLETMQDLDVRIVSNNPENPYEQMTTEEIARALPEYDHVIPY